MCCLSCVISACYFHPVKTRQEEKSSSEIRVASTSKITGRHQKSLRDAAMTLLTAGAVHLSSFNTSPSSLSLSPSLSLSLSLSNVHPLLGNVCLWWGVANIHSQCVNRRGCSERELSRPEAVADTPARLPVKEFPPPFKKNLFARNAFSVIPKNVR